MSEPLLRPCVALVPVKPSTTAKSRLAGLPPGQREALALAFAHDVLEAVRQSPVFVATVVASDETTLPADLVVPDAGDLNASLRAAAAAARRRWPQARPVALASDLPCLSAGDLIVFSDLSAPAFVSDAAGTGTTSYTAEYDVFEPRFGRDSTAAHLAGGATALAAHIRLRRDVDTPDDLAQALTLGVGRHTAAVLAG